MPFDRGNRSYHVSDERLRAFRALSTEEKLRWVEELASFLRLAQPVESDATRKDDKQDPPAWTRNRFKFDCDHEKSKKQGSPRIRPLRCPSEGAKSDVITAADKLKAS